MIFACGLSNYDVSLFHLSNHAFFKALLFLGAGSIIHAINDEQDMRKMGGLKNILPFSYSTILIGSLALIGFPFLTGFFSKDTILEVAFAKYTFSSHFCYYLGTMSAFFTAFYSTRLLFLVFLSEPNGNKIFLTSAHESKWNIFLPLFLLSFFSIFIGFLTKDIFIGFGGHFWGSSIFIKPNNYIALDYEFISIVPKLMPFIFTLIGVFFSYFLYSFESFTFFEIKKNIFFKTIYSFFNKKWYFDRLYNQFFSQNFLNLSYSFSYKTFDRGVLEYFGPLGVIREVTSIINYLKFYYSGNIFHVLLLLFFSLIFILVNFIFFSFFF
jgi:NADH-ubiquinone oxidoreductase chain 5